MSQISQLSKFTISIAVSITVTVTLSPLSLPQLPPVLQLPNHLLCHIILWLADVVPFPPIGTCFFLLANTFCLQNLSWEKPVFIASSCSKHAANVTTMFAKTVADIIHCESGFTWPINVPARPSTWLMCTNIILVTSQPQSRQSCVTPCDLWRPPVGGPDPRLGTIALNLHTTLSLIISA